MAVLALMGSGEFLPWARDVDRWCAENATASSDRALVVPTASSPEGAEVFNRWGSMGKAHYKAIGLTPRVVKLRERADASKPEFVDLVADSRLIFFSGGNPGYLAEALEGTPFWEAVVDAVAHGTALGGCSAGMVALGVKAPYVGTGDEFWWVPGLALLPKAYLAPHFDGLDGFMPGLRQIVLDARPEGSILFAVDENTVAYGDGEHWTVTGTGGLTVTNGDAPDAQLIEYRAGQTFTLPLEIALP